MRMREIRSMPNALTSHFFRVQLRTLDVDAARTFYASVLDSRALHMVPLHEQAIARGARPHWLGFILVEDVARAAELFTQRGAAPLGPKWVNPDGLEAAVMRDPGGAIVALGKPAGHADELARAAGPTSEVVSCTLNTADVERARTIYQALFGWSFQEPLELGPLGRLHPFGFRPGAAPVSAMLDTAGRAGVHPHWLFHFRVEALEPAIERVREAGGSALPTMRLPNGERLAVCDDPQGAAFALHERATK
jgi:predicted enzyme related to lactoylglutathione lyase